MTAVCCPTCLSRARISIGRLEASERMIKAELMRKSQQQSNTCSTLVCSNISVVSGSFCCWAVFKWTHACFDFCTDEFFQWVFVRRRLKRFNPQKMKMKRHFGTLECWSCKNPTLTLSPYEVVTANILANTYLFTGLADVEQHSSVVVFVPTWRNQDKFELFF